MLHNCYGMVLLACVGMLAACSGIKTYPDSLEKNLIIKVATDSGSFFSAVKASLDIYDVDADCNVSYIGTVKLDRPTVEVGVRPEHISYLSFRFNSSGFLSNSSSQISYDTLVKLHKKYRYDVSVRYKNDIYNVEIVEKRSANTQGREIAVRQLQQCNQL